MNVFYASVKEASNGALDLYVYPAAVVYPSYGSDFAWSANHKSGTTLLSGTAFDADLRAFFSSGFTSRQHEHAMALTGLDLLGSDGSSGLLGYAYVGTVCVNTQYKYSINEYTASNVAWVASHELGHALGSQHDQSTDCPAGRNVMSAYLFSPSSTTADTYSRFSTCSASQFITHLNSKTDCTAQNGFTDEQFRASFCSGLLGQRDNSLNYQCQQRTGYAGSTVCSGTISGDAGCYAYGQVACRDASGACSVRLGFVWNGTPCGIGRMCFKGRCVANFDVCNSVTTAAPTTAAPTTAAPTTAAPTTAAPTTAAPTTAAPTTAAPTTAAPTTAAPTTAVPTTAAPTTAAPTTAAPTTAAPTTAAQTTAAPTTAAPTTAAPTTAAPTTAAPTTAAPTTAGPTTAAPTTAAPTTAAPTTAAPTTAAPTTAAPTTAVPTTAAPTTAAPTTAAPTTAAPTTAAPTTAAPTTAAPTTAAPTTAAPTTAAPTTAAPTTAGPTTAAPTTAAPTTAAPTTAAPTPTAPCDCCRRRVVYSAACCDRNYRRFKTVCPCCPNPSPFQLTKNSIIPDDDEQMSE
ncbi:mucin-19-like [Dreissena polymorpha]|nr:mucin-19-like [Dreissena polymorpha]